MPDLHIPTVKMAQVGLPYRVVAIASHCGAMRHLVLFDSKPNTRTLCGMSWGYILDACFNPKYDCQRCRKIQETRA